MALSDLLGLLRDPATATVATLFLYFLVIDSYRRIWRVENLLLNHFGLKAKESRKDGNKA